VLESRGGAKEKRRQPASPSYRQVLFLVTMMHVRGRCWRAEGGEGETLPTSLYLLLPSPIPCDNACAGMVLESKGCQGEALPSGLLSCSSNPREIGAELEPRCVDDGYLQSQVGWKLRGKWRCNSRLRGYHLLATAMLLETGGLLNSVKNRWCQIGGCIPSPHGDRSRVSGKRWCQIGGYAICIDATSS
jgi:hypothetical protein